MPNSQEDDAIAARRRREDEENAEVLTKHEQTSFGDAVPWDVANQRDELSDIRVEELERLKLDEAFAENDVLGVEPDDIVMKFPKPPPDTKSLPPLKQPPPYPFETPDA